MDKQQLLRRLGWEPSPERFAVPREAWPTQGLASSLGRVDLPPARSQTVELEPLSDILDRASRQLHESARVHADCLHVSSLVGDYLCPRQIWLANHYHLTAIDRVRPAMKIVWDMGRACEKTVRDLLITGMGRSRVLGKWSCACGATTQVGQGQELDCNICDTACDIYGEADLYYSPLKIFGHSDFIYLDEARNVNVVEIKSINKSDWLTLEAPRHTHVAQVSMYYFMLRESMGRERMYPGGAHYLCVQRLSYAANAVEMLHGSAGNLRKRGRSDIARGDRASKRICSCLPAPDELLHVAGMQRSPKLCCRRHMFHAC